MGNGYKSISKTYPDAACVKKQILQAIDIRYLKALQKSVTNLITQSVLDILTFLNSRYGRVNIIQLSEAKTELKVFVYDLTNPIDEAIFQRIDNYTEITDMANAPVSERQKINLAIIMIIKSNRFQIDIQTWNSKDLADKAWENFRDNFCSAHNSL